MKNHIYFLVLFLVLSGIGLFLYKVLVMGFPMVPGTESLAWSIEAHVSFKTKNEPVKVTLFVPNNNEYFSIVSENFISRGYGFNTLVNGENREAVWSIRNARGVHNLYYRAKLRKKSSYSFDRDHTFPDIKENIFKGVYATAAKAVIAEIREKSADMNSFVSELLKYIRAYNGNENMALLLNRKENITNRMSLAVGLLAQAGIPARVVNGISLKKDKKNLSLSYLLEVYDSQKWMAFEPESCKTVIPEDYFVWWRGSAPLISARGVVNPKVELSVMSIQEKTIDSAVERGKVQQPLLLKFSIFSLPIKTQFVFRILLLVAVGAFVLVFLRSIIGVKTLGTFMPVLIALSFRETQLLWGLFFFSFIVMMGLTVRLYFQHLKLLVVPRLAAVLIVVILLMLIICIVTNSLGIEQGISIALFPMVILTMTIERISIIWDETGPKEALMQGAGTLFVSCVAYTIINNSYVEHLIYVFPELLLVVLAASLMLGKYSGYRLMEYIRFKALMK